MPSTFGIDLGTTNSVISRLVAGKPVPIPIDGSPIVPSVVLFGEGPPVVGRRARNLELEHPDRTVRSVKRRMGTQHRYSVAGSESGPEDVSAEILRALKAGAEAHAGEPVHDVVITVPAYFNDAQRKATLRAGELAGLNVLRLLNEPTSASLVYDQLGTAAGNQSPEVVLIYDLGGGTFDVSVLEVFEGVREVRATAGNTALGGDDFDELLVRAFLDELKRSQAVDPRGDPRAMARLRRLAEETKIRLSADTRVEIREHFLTQQDGRTVNLVMEVTRRQFEDLLRPMLQTTVALARQAVADARLDGQQLSRVCLVGGSTRIPLVRSLLREAFDVEIFDQIDADLAVGLGASIQAGMLAGVELDRILVDVAAHSLGIKVFSQEDELRAGADTFAPLIPRNSVLPCQHADEFYTMHDDQKKIEVEVYQGEADRVSANARVGAFDYPLESVPEGSPIRVEFAYDLNGVVRVSVSQPGTKNSKTVALAVSDASAAPAGAAGASPVERKAVELLARLPAADRARVEALLARLRQAPAGERETVEEALLDLFVDLDA